MPSINPQAVRGPVTAVPVVAGTGVRFVEDVENNRVVAEVDETVIYSGDLVQTQQNTAVSDTMTETFRNFERILIVGHTDDGLKSPFTILLEVLNDSGDMEWSLSYGNAGWAKWFVGKMNGTTLTLTLGRVNTMGTTTWGYLVNWGITKIVGINRIASN